MRKSLFVLPVAVLLLGVSAFAQNCNSVISDEANALNSTDTAVVVSQANKLIDAGLQPHVVVLQNLGKYGSLSNAEAAYESKCSSWMDGKGHRQGNLLVLIHSIGDRKYAAFYGGALHNALGDQASVDHLLSNAAVPFFKHGQYAGGYAAAFRDIGAKNASAHNAAAPVQKTTTIINDSTASSHAVEWVFGLLFLAALIGLVVWLLMRRNSNKAEIEEAQQEAQSARQKATNAFRAADSANAGYSDIASQFSELSNAVSYDPSTTGLSAASYNAMTKAWNGLAADIRALRSPVPAPYTPTPEPKAAAAAAGAEPVATFPGPYTPPVYSRPDYSRDVPVQQPTVIHEHTTYVERDNSGDMLTGMLIGESIANSNRESEREERRYEEPSYQSPSYSEPERSTRDDDSNSNDLSYSASSNDDDSNNNDSSSDDNSYSSDDSSSSDSGSGDSGSGDQSY